MNKLFTFIVKLSCVIAFSVWLVETPGSVSISWHDYIIDTSASFFILIVMGAAGSLYYFFRIINFIKNGPVFWRLNKKLLSIEEGNKALASGLVAIASGNPIVAGSMAIQARRQLGTTPVTQLLQAQAAHLAGDHAAARELYFALASNSDTAALGYRGLILEAQQNNDWDESEKLVEKLFRVNPEAPWVSFARFQIMVRKQNWQNALDTISAAHKNKLINVRDYKGPHTAVLIALSQHESGLGKFSSALAYAEQAVQISPLSTAAIINLATQQLASGHKRACLRTITKNWGSTPHPTLAALYIQQEDTALEAFKKIQKLCRAENDDYTNQRILAEYALAANIWGESRRFLQNMINQGKATQSIYKLLARLDLLEHNNEDEAVKWLTKAADATHDPVWLCFHCGHFHEQWQATCTSCQSFNSLDWLIPGQGISRSLMSSSSNNWVL